jgi:hypothetical protein
MVNKQLSMMPNDVLAKVVGDNSDKIMEIYRKDPNVANDDRLLILAFWREYDGLKDVLGDKYPDFCDWWAKQATKPESIRRSRQSLTERKIMLPKKKTADNREAMRSGYWKYYGDYR